jgi:D-alanine-D-alanine ligase
MRIALLHNLRPNGPYDEAFEEYDSPATIAAIATALRRLGVEVDPIEADRTLPSRLETGRYDFAFNIAEGAGRRSREAIAPAICELFEIPYTGSDPLTLAVTLDKAIARRIVSPDLRVAAAVILESELESITYPAIVKPNDEGSSKGIHADSVVDNPAQAAIVMRRLRDRYGCPVLVEEFLSGPEVTVGILGHSVLGMMEIAPKSSTHRFIYSIDVKRDWRNWVEYYVPPRLPSSTLATLEEQALTAYRLLGCRDFARIDFRLDHHGQPVFLECNALPGLDPENSDLVLMTRGQTTYDCLVQSILREACKRTGVQLP